MYMRLRTRPARILPTLILSALAACGLSSVATAASLHCDSVRDTTIYQGQNPDNNNTNGLTDFFSAGRNNDPNSTRQIQRALIQFDLAGIPANATITSATLNLRVTKVSGEPEASTTRHFWLIALKDIVPSKWGEGGTENTTRPPSGQGVQAVEGRDDTTWYYEQYKNVPWPSGKEGAIGPDPRVLPLDDDVGTAVGTGAVSWTKNQTSDQMIKDIQAWVNGTLPNEGWALIGEESTAASAKGSKREFASMNHANSSYRPGLTVTYTVPEPATTALCLVAALAATAVAGRRKKVVTRSS